MNIRNLFYSLVIANFLVLIPNSASAQFQGEGGIYGNLNYHKFKKLYSLEPLSVPKHPVHLPKCRPLELSHEGHEYGYGVEFVRPISIFAGAGLTESSENNEDFFDWKAVGLSGMYDTYVYFKGVGATKELAKKKFKRSVPKKPKDIAKWDQGDAMYFSKSIGVAVSTPAGISEFYFAPSITLKAKWDFYLEKNGPNRYYVSASRGSAKVIGFGSGMIIADGSISKRFDKDQTYSYEVIVRNEKIANAILDFIAGDLTKLQALTDNKLVIPLEDIKEKENSSTFYFGLGTPFIGIINAALSKKKFTKEENKKTSWGESSDELTAGYFYNRNYHFLKFQNFDFTHTTLASKDAYTEYDDDIQDYVSGVRDSVTLTYQYDSNINSLKGLNKFLKRLYKKSDFINEYFCYEVPKLKKAKFKRLGFKWKWSDAMIKYIQQEILENPNLSHKHSKGLVKRINLIKEKSVTDRSYVKALRKLARYAWHKKDVADLFMNIGLKCGMEISFEVSGEKLKRINQYYKWVKTDDCPIKDAQSTYL